MTFPCPLGLAWSTMAKAMAVTMRPAWAASWHPWCRLPSTGSIGPAAASWSSAATSRRFPPPQGRDGIEWQAHLSVTKGPKAWENY